MQGTIPESFGLLRNLKLLWLGEWGYTILWNVCILIYFYMYKMRLIFYAWGWYMKMDYSYIEQFIDRNTSKQAWESERPYGIEFA